MKKILLASAVLASSLFANIYTLEPVKITKDTTCFIGDLNPPMKQNKGFVSNVCYIDIGDSVVVIEPGPTYNFAKELNQFIKTNTNKKVSHVIATNFHDDRYTGASFYKENNIPIIGHKTIVQELEENPDKFNRIPKVTTKEEYKNSKVVQPDILTDDKYIIKGSKQNIEILKLSDGSNSVSDIAVYVPKDDFIFAGNIIFNGRMIKYGKYSNVDNWIEALNNLKNMNVKYVLGGHGFEYDKNSYKPTLEYLTILRDSVKKAYEDDVDREELSPYIDDKKFNYYKHFKAISTSNPKRYYDQLEWVE
ncbi:MBL fold metallo-hydrolase [Arcobacter sp. 15-2]|uniref:MBL fold metallo-hydrolase n=1 Tax=Arcobacter sp. 15-2 TaxID=3374109 RepID=UPI00399C8341